jgi:hypothetical protein
MQIDTQEILKNASGHLAQLPGHVFDVLSLSKPVTIENALNICKIVSKLSPLIGNLIEFNTVDFLNSRNDFSGIGKWKRQDPGFPDTIFEGSVQPTPGFEIKAWFPLATEITARFKDSQNHFKGNQTNVAIIAWLPEHVIFGRPKIVGIEVVTGASVAKARDEHYHNPPDYLVLEPEDTSKRTSNLQQTNTNGYKLQETGKKIEVADKIVRSWGSDGKKYKPTTDYQKRLRTLLAKFNYRLDTNYAKMDRIVHEGVEQFKTRIFSTPFHGMSIQEWNDLLSKGSEAAIAKGLKENLKIIDEPKKIELKVKEESPQAYGSISSPAENLS